MFGRFLQSIKVPKNSWDDFIYVPLFIFVITINKYILSELQFTLPTVFQGWHTFACVLLLSILIKFEKIKNDLQVLEKKTVFQLLPVLLCFVVSIVAGSKALARVPVPVFVAILNVNPALEILFLEKENNKNGNPFRICGSIIVCGTVITILIFSFMQYYYIAYDWLMGHVILNFIQSYYMHILQLDLTNVTYIYYRNFFSVIVLFPISICLDLVHIEPSLNTWKFYLGCLLSGIFGTFLQLWHCKVESKRSYFNSQSFAKLLCSLIAYKLFFANIEPVVWFLIILNLVTGIFAFSSKESDACLETLKVPAETSTHEEKKRVGF